MSPRRLAASALLSLTACGGIAYVDGGGGNGNGGGGTGGTSCQRTYDAFAFSFSPADGGPSLDCASAMPGTHASTHVEASVVQLLDTGGVLLDTCPPNADCDGSTLHVLQVGATGLFLQGLSVGQFVQVDIQVDYPWGCSQSLLVRNLPFWGGLESSGGSLPWVVVAGADGVSSAPEGAPFSIDAVALGCVGVDQGCGIEDDFRLDFTTPSGTVPVHQGETSWINLPDEPMAGLVVRNLRSFETGWCDDYWNWGWWAAFQYGLD